MQHKVFVKNIAWCFIEKLRRIFCENLRRSLFKVGGFVENIHFFSEGFIKKLWRLLRWKPETISLWKGGDTSWIRPQLFHLKSDMGHQGQPEEMSPKHQHVKGKWDFVPGVLVRNDGEYSVKTREWVCSKVEDWSTFSPRVLLRNDGRPLSWKQENKSVKRCRFWDQWSHCAIVSNSFTCSSVFDPQLNSAKANSWR